MLFSRHYYLVWIFSEHYVKIKFWCKNNFFETFILGRPHNIDYTKLPNMRQLLILPSDLCSPLLHKNVIITENCSKTPKGKLCPSKTKKKKQSNLSKKRKKSKDALRQSIGCSFGPGNFNGQYLPKIWSYLFNIRELTIIY